MAATYCSCLEMPRQKFLEALDKHPEDCRSVESVAVDHRHTSTCIDIVRRRTISSSYNLRDLRMCFKNSCWWLHLSFFLKPLMHIGFMNPLRISRISEPRLTRLHASKLATEQGTWRFLSKARVWQLSMARVPGFSAAVSEIV